MSVGVKQLIFDIKTIRHVFVGKSIDLFRPSTPPKTDVLGRKPVMVENPY